MTRAENELFDLIMSRWVSYYEAIRFQEEIAKTGESIFGKIFDFQGDLPSPGLFKPETICARVDKQRRVRISHEERQAADILNRVPIRFSAYIKFDALYNNQFCQSVLAAECQLTLDQYKKRKYKAKKFVVYFANLASVKAPKNYILCSVDKTALNMP